MMYVVAPIMYVLCNSTSYHCSSVLAIEATSSTNTIIVLVAIVQEVVLVLVVVVVVTIGLG